MAYPQYPGGGGGGGGYGGYPNGQPLPYGTPGAPLSYGQQQPYPPQPNQYGPPPPGQQPPYPPQYHQQQQHQQPYPPATSQGQFPTYHYHYPNPSSSGYPPQPPFPSEADPQRHHHYPPPRDNPYEQQPYPQGHGPGYGPGYGSATTGSTSSSAVSSQRPDQFAYERHQQSYDRVTSHGRPNVLSGPRPNQYFPPPYHPTAPATVPVPQSDARVSNFRPSGRKRALLIGINYSGPGELKGCVSDVMCVHYLLSTKFGFHQSDFVVMTDRSVSLPSGVRRGGRPTKQNMIAAMKEFVGSAGPGDSLFFQFSGHGSQVRDTNGDESDGMDETILPVDYSSAGQIVDDDLYKILVRGLPEGSRLTALMDCCHSGTGLDLPYIHDMLYSGSGTITDGAGAKPSAVAAVATVIGALASGGPVNALKESVKVASGFVIRKKVRQHEPDPRAGEVVLFSGCLDNQVSADTNMMSGTTVTGAMTYCFIQAIEHGSVGDWHQYTYRNLLQTMRQKLTEAGLRQTPQFSTSHPFDLSSPFII